MGNTSSDEGGAVLGLGQSQDLAALRCCLIEVSKEKPVGTDGSRSSHEKSRWAVTVFEHSKGEVADDFPLW